MIVAKHPDFKHPMIYCGMPLEYWELLHSTIANQDEPLVGSPAFFKIHNDIGKLLPRMKPLVDTAEPFLQSADDAIVIVSPGSYTHITHCSECNVTLYRKSPLPTRTCPTCGNTMLCLQ